MSDVFFSSDTHFCHNQPFLYEPRGFQSVEEMNEAIIERWNKVVKPDDIVYNLGDIALKDTQAAIPYLQALNGTQYWLLGNHDHPGRVKAICAACPNIKVDRHTYATTIGFKDSKIYLSHYPTITSNYDFDKPFNRHVINMHGHTHQTTNWNNPEDAFMYHVGLDSHNFTPVNIEEAITDIKNRFNGMRTQVPTIDFTGIRPGYECV